MSGDQTGIVLARLGEHGPMIKIPEPIPHAFAPNADGGIFEVDARTYRGAHYELAEVMGYGGEVTATYRFVNEARPIGAPSWRGR